MTRGYILPPPQVTIGMKYPRSVRMIGNWRAEGRRIKNSVCITAALLLDLRWWIICFNLKSGSRFLFPLDGIKKGIMDRPLSVSYHFCSNCSFLFLSAFNKRGMRQLKGKPLRQRKPSKIWKLTVRSKQNVTNVLSA